MNKVYASSLAVLASPCVRNCCLDEDDVCLGCGRHLNDILAWRNATAEEQKAILESAQKRLKKKRN